MRIAAAVAERGTPGAGWMGANGVVTLLLAVLIGAELPESSDWAIGLLVGSTSSSTASARSPRPALKQGMPEGGGRRLPEAACSSSQAPP